MWNTFLFIMECMVLPFGCVPLVLHFWSCKCCMHATYTIRHDTLPYLQHTLAISHHLYEIHFIYDIYMCMHVCKGYGLPGRRVGLHGHWLLAMGAWHMGAGCFALHWALAFGEIWAADQHRSLSFLAGQRRYVER